MSGFTLDYQELGSISAMRSAAQHVRRSASMCRPTTVRHTRDACNAGTMPGMNAAHHPSNFFLRC